ncbi:hypothetical protein [Acidibrevibacterium fodinaquatile]|uniref:hypothetical protein n=1 Tax=Acidibrevibacterium fodinaquatile TaxID=1969806 RepID=UPI00196698A9|nr:hypothetical protein [Acidibrevibacterium fodinaquatile]
MADFIGIRIPRPNTQLIDSEQLESGEALDPAFRDMAGPEIAQFKPTWWSAPATPRPPNRSPTNNCSAR